MIHLTHGSDPLSTAPDPPPALVVAISGGEPEERSHLKAELGQVENPAVEVSEPHPASADSGPDPDVMMALLASPPVSWQRELKALRQSSPHTFIIAIIAGAGAELWRAALRAGADDVLAMPPAPDELARALLKASELRAREAHSLGKVICSLVSLTGGVGVTQLAVNLAFTIRRLFPDRETAAVDLDLQSATLAVTLDLEPEHTILELADPTSVIDSIRMESALTKHESGLLLLAAPRRIADCELVSASTIESALRVLRQLCGVVLVDCGSHMSEGQVSAWEQSDYLLYVIEQSVTAVRNALRFQELCRSLELSVQPSYVLNQHTPGGPVSPQQIEEALQQPLFASLPRDDKACAEMQVTGRNVWNVSDGAELRRALESLARKLLLREAEEPASRPGLLVRLRGLLGG